jgi:hypothetical protein
VKGWNSKRQLAALAFATVIVLWLVCPRIAALNALWSTWAAVMLGMAIVIVDIEWLMTLLRRTDEHQH